MLSSLELHYTYVAGALVVAIGLFWLRGRHLISTVYTSDFIRLRRTFFLSYGFLLTAVWLENHSSYHSDSGELIIIHSDEHHTNLQYGLIAFATFGSIGGVLMDQCGRRCMLVFASLLYAIACLLRHVEDPIAAIVSAGLVGLCHPLLMVGIDTWLIHEHKRVRHLQLKCELDPRHPSSACGL